MTETLSIACVVRPSKYFGYKVLPYYYEKLNQTTYVIKELVSVADEPGEIGDDGLAKKIYDIGKRLDPNHIARKFSDKNTGTDAFFKQLEQKYLQRIILPYFWKETSNLIKLIQQNNIPLYDDEHWLQVSKQNQVKIANVESSLRLIFDRNENEIIYTLEIWHDGNRLNLQNSMLKILTVEPCFFISNGQLYKLESNISGQMLQPFLQKKSIHIPKRVEKEYFKKFIRKVANQVQIEARGFTVKDMKPEVKPILTIENDWQGNPGVTLSFDYEERVVLPNNSQRTFTNLIINNDDIVFKRFTRNQEQENHFIESVRKLGLNEHGAFYKYSNGDPNDAMLHFIRFISDHLKSLENAGFEIRQGLKRPYILEKPELITQYTFQNDWFDLHIQIRAGNHSIRFMDLKNHIINNIKVYELDSGELFVIPDEWFERYKSLSLIGKIDNDRIRIKKMHFRLLTDLNIKEANDIDSYEASADIDEMPDIRNTNLRPYQNYGYLWLRRNINMGFGALLADDMGLGKTLQVIALLSSFYKENQSADHQGTGAHPAREIPQQKQLSLFDNHNSHKGEGNIHSKLSAANPALIVMPTSIFHNWKNEFRRFAPQLSLYEYYGSNRTIKPLMLRQANIILTTYGTVRNDIELLKNINFSFVILDESQQIKNPLSKMAKTITVLQSVHRLALTGTPVENNLIDLWSQLNFINPGLPGSLPDFNRHFTTPLSRNPDAPEGKELLKMISPFILRRTKAQVEPELPPLTENIIYCDMTESQQKLYEVEKSRQRNFLLENRKDKSSRQKSLFVLLKALMRLRQYANHPQMVSGTYDAESGKFDMITETLETLIAEKHKVLVFSSFVSHLNLLGNYFLANSIRFCKLIGASRNRESVISNFRNNDEISVFLISLKAGGVGLNLTEAGYVLILEPWWNPAAEMQAISRAHRIGQNKPVFVYRFISKDTIEEKILKLQENKKNLAEKFIREEKILAGMSMEEMIELLS
jgi:SNF2 family DNA or RNA helicase